MQSVLVSVLELAVGFILISVFFRLTGERNFISRFFWKAPHASKIHTKFIFIKPTGRFRKAYLYLPGEFMPELIGFGHDICTYTVGMLL